MPQKWEIPINITTDVTWKVRHSYQHHCWSHLIYNMDGLCTSETFISTPLLISPDLQYDCRCTSETFLSTPLLISLDLQDRLCLYFWDIHINTTTDLTWSTISTFFVLLRPFYQHHYWSHLIYKMNCLSTSETLLSTPLPISPDLQDRLFLYFWDISINTTTDLNWSTRWTGFLLLRHSYQHHYWSHLIYKIDCPCTSETFLSIPLLISPDLQDELALYFWDISINTTTDLTWSTR